MKKSKTLKTKKTLEKGSFYFRRIFSGGPWTLEKLTFWLLEKHPKKSKDSKKRVFGSAEKDFWPVPSPIKPSSNERKKFSVVENFFDLVFPPSRNFLEKRNYSRTIRSFLPTFNFENFFRVSKKCVFRPSGERKFFIFHDGPITISFIENQKSKEELVDFFGKVFIRNNLGLFKKHFLLTNEKEEKRQKRSQKI